MQKKFLTALFIGAFVFGVGATNIQTASAADFDKIGMAQDKIDMSQDNRGYDRSNPPEPPRDANGNPLPPPKDANGNPLPPPNFDGDNGRPPEPPRDANGNPLPPPKDANGNPLPPPNHGDNFNK